MNVDPIVQYLMASESHNLLKKDKFSQIVNDYDWFLPFMALNSNQAAILSAEFDLA